MCAWIITTNYIMLYFSQKDHHINQAEKDMVITGRNLSLGGADLSCCAFLMSISICFTDLLKRLIFFCKFSSDARHNKHKIYKTSSYSCDRNEAKTVRPKPTFTTVTFLQTLRLRFLCCFELDGW